MDKKPGYAGSISHNGAQVVKAPIADPGKKGTTVKKSGDDLRK